jgi:HAD superfamily hydrolase (TIGR01509 family)
MTLPRAPRAVVFDMDGLIIDTESLYRDAVRAVAAAEGHDVSMELYGRTIGLTIDATRLLFTGHFGVQFDFDRFWAASAVRFHAMAETQLCLKSGVVELLDALDDADLPRAIATSSSHRSVTRHLKPHGVLERFQAVVAHGDYERGKPNPDPFLTAALRLGVAPEDCLALEDSHNGVRAAAAAGMMTIMVPDLLDPTDEMQALCVRIARDLHEVRGLLQALARRP